MDVEHPPHAPVEADVALSAAELRGRARIIARYTGDAAVLPALAVAAVLARVLDAAAAVDDITDALLLDLRARTDDQLLTFAQLEEITGVADSTLSSRHKAAERRQRRAQSTS